MIGKMIAAFVGSKAAEKTSALGGAGGAALGVATTMLIRRMSLPALATIAAGGYLAKKLTDKADEAPATKANTPAV